MRTIFDNILHWLAEKVNKPTPTDIRLSWADLTETAIPEEMRLEGCNMFGEYYQDYVVLVEVIGDYEFWKSVQVDNCTYQVHSGVVTVFTLEDIPKYVKET